ncbi:MAG: anaerobic sulfatase maturase [Deltaproteobacteria bacterium]|nr:anaerobic sulfatase maturase [Deltaproteobacteria bacterium]
MLDEYDAPIITTGKISRHFHVMIKPGGSSCNLKCAYCFYLSKAQLPNGPGSGRMSEEILEKFIRQYLEGVTQGEIVFSWQGGEPTLLGLDFFQKAMALQKKYAKPGQQIENDLQTNGTLITTEWCHFLKEHRFLVGLSIDGPREIHDKFRVTASGQPSFEKVFSAAKLLMRHGVPFNTLTCVNSFNAKKPLDVYNFLRRELRATRMQFIPIVEYRNFEKDAPNTWDSARLPLDGTPEARPGHANSIVTPWSVDPDEWGYFLCKTFDAWRSKDLGKVMVNHFETLVAQHLGLPAQLCSYSQYCGKGVALEHDGSLYSCDHYVYPQYCLGNIKNETLSDQVFSRRQLKFAYAKSETLPKYCRVCPYLSDRWGECPKNRLIKTPDGEPGLNYLCRGFKKFFAHAIPSVELIVRRLRQV